MSPTDNPDYYPQLLKAIAAGSYLHVAKRPSPSEPKVYESVRHGARGEVSGDSNFGPSNALNE